MKQVRSPLFYVGDKYKLMPQLKELFPKNINTFYDVFTGGGSASLNTLAKHYVLNDLDKHIISLHKYLSNELKNPFNFINHEINLIEKFGLTHSAQNVFPNNISELKNKYKKTYLSKANKSSYNKMRDIYNFDQSRNDLFYLLLVFGFNHMTRFNNDGNFNLPVGNVDWNKNVEQALMMYSHFVMNSDYQFSAVDFEQFVKDKISNKKINKNDFFYFDPPYSNTSSEYNKMWHKSDDQRLLDILDLLDSYNIKWGLSNLFSYQGKQNIILKKWSCKYSVFPIQANYISHFNNTIKRDTREAYITNLK